MFNPALYSQAQEVNRAAAAEGIAAPVLSGPFGIQTANYNLTWEAVPDVTGYELYASADGVSFALVASPLAAATSYLVNIAANFGTPYWRLIGKFVSSETPPSNIVFVEHGEAEPPAFVGPLDSYTADLTAAWSASRRLLSAYTGPLLRVRRTSDSTESDIGYDGDGLLDTATLATFIGANDARIVTFYDQSGNGRHFTQATAAEQIRLAAAGVIDTIGTNSRPTGKCTLTGTGCYTQASVFATYTGDTISAYGVAALTSGQTNAVVILTAKDGLSGATTARGGMTRNGTNQQLSILRSAAVAPVSIVYGTPFAAGWRQDGDNAHVRIGATTNTAANGLPFDINRYIIGGLSSSLQTMGNNDLHAEGAIWTSNLGDATLQTILTEASTHFGV